MVARVFSILISDISHLLFRYVISAVCFLLLFERVRIGCKLCSSLQVNGYAAKHGIKYGMISNLLWSWAYEMDGTNNMQIS